MKYYAIRNELGLFWNSEVEAWGKEATMFTQHGRDTYALPLGGVWIYVLTM